MPLFLGNIRYRQLVSRLMTGSLPIIAFVVFVLAMLALDLGILNRKKHEVKPKEASLWVVFWVVLAVLFNIGVYVLQGSEKGLQFTTAYLIEQTLSIDNMFVFVLIMRSFRVAKNQQHRLLFFGILGALVMRGGMIGAGLALVERFHWLLYAFGAFLLYTSFRIITDANDETQSDPTQSPAVRFVTKHFPKLKSNHLLLALICLEFTDVLFAMDSIPAILSVSSDAFILYTSNVFAILGLRSLYFLLAHAIDKFHLLNYGIAVVLGFVGVKMLSRDVIDLPMAWSLTFIVLVIAASVALSLVVPPRHDRKPSAQK